MRIRAALDGIDISYAVLIESLAIRQDSREAISTAEIMLRDTSAMSARYDIARYDQDRYASAIEIREWQQLSIYDQDTLQILFAGFVLSVGREQESNRVRYKLAASDWGILFERTLITHTWPNGTPDSTIVADALALVPELTAGTIVTQVTNLGAIEAKDQRIRDLLDEVCELTGSEWSVSYDGKLNYYRIGSVVAPFALSDAPNGTTTMPYQIENYDNDFSDAANRVLALGGLTDAGEIRSTANEPASQARYGVLSATVIDRNITDVQTAAVWAQTEVAQRAFPKPTITAALYAPGLARGMTVGVTSVDYGISASLVLRSLQLAIAAPDRQRAGGPGHVVKYTAVLGSRPPDLVYRLRRMQRKPPDRTIVPPTPVVPGSITGGSLAAGLGLIYIVAAKPTVWTQYPADATFFNTADRKLYRRIAGNDWTAVVPTEDIEGQIQTHQLAPGSVTTTILADGSVVTAKIPTGAITAPQLGPGAVTGPAIQASAVTADKIAANAIEATHISAGSVTATALAAGSVTANAIAANAVIRGSLAGELGHGDRYRGQCRRSGQDRSARSGRGQHRRRCRYCWNDRGRCRAGGRYRGGRGDRRDDRGQCRDLDHDRGRRDHGGSYSGRRHRFDQVEHDRTQSRRRRLEAGEDQRLRCERHDPGRADRGARRRPVRRRVQGVRGGGRRLCFRQAQMRYLREPVSDEREYQHRRVRLYADHFAVHVRFVLFVARPDDRGRRRQGGARVARHCLLCVELDCRGSGALAFRQLGRIDVSEQRQRPQGDSQWANGHDLCAVDDPFRWRILLRRLVGQIVFLCVRGGEVHYI